MNEKCGITTCDEDAILVLHGVKQPYPYCHEHFKATVKTYNNVKGFKEFYRNPQSRLVVNYG